MFFFKQPNYNNPPPNVIPDEILWEVFSYLQPADILALARTQKSFYHSVIYATEFWQNLYEHHFPTEPITSPENKTWFEVFMETYIKDYPDPEVRRLVFLIRSNDLVNLSKFLRNKHFTIDSFDVRGDITGKTGLEWAQESGNQALLDCLYDTVNQRYREKSNNVCTNNLISQAIATEFTSIDKYPSQFTEGSYQKATIKASVINYLHHNAPALQEKSVKSEDIAIAPHHNITKDPKEIERDTRICIETNILVAVAKTIALYIAEHKDEILNAINFINNKYLHNSDFDYRKASDIYKIINFIQQQMEKGLMEPEYQTLINLVMVAQNAAYSANSDTQGRTILYWAIALQQKSAIIEKLLQSGSQVGERYIELGYRPLHIAASVGNLEATQTLLAGEASPNVLNTGDSIFVDYEKAGDFKNYLPICVDMAFDDYEENLDLYDDITLADFPCTPPIHLACKQGHASTVVYLIQQDIQNATERNNDNDEPIDVAINNGRIEVIDSLLKLSPKFFNRDNDNSSLILAAHKQQADLFSYFINYLLLQRYNRINKIPSTTEINTELEEELAHRGYIGIRSVDALLKDFLIWANSELLNPNKFKNISNFIELFARNIYAKDPDYLAVLTTNLTLSPTTRNIIEKSSAKVKPEQLPSLINAGDLESVKFVVTSLDRLVDKDKQGQTLVDLANQGEKKQLILDYFYQLAFQFYCDDSVINTHKREHQRRILYWAIACQQKEEVIQGLLNKGSKVTERYLDSQQPLHIAAQYGNHTIIPLLIENGADTKAIDNLGQTPIHLAIQHGHLDTVRLFIECDPSLLTHKYDKANSLLHYAARYDNKGNILDFLINTKKTDLKAYDFLGFQPIHIATKANNFVAIEKFYKLNNQLLEEQDREGRTPLAIAIEENHTALVKELLNLGANLNITIKGKTPREVAELNSNEDIIKLIASHEEPKTKKANVYR
ncbi:ankyrin repeat domain-containing protein [Legionella sp. D16C41]|uniref:ankyrin repeat domain-containing protein n=1 Tax=Legionella sp. D16C41 TaxID=3402688 RepID=UPI003AF663E8